MKRRIFMKLNLPKIFKNYMILLLAILMNYSVSIASPDVTQQYHVDTTIDGIHLKGYLPDILAWVDSEFYRKGYLQGDHTTARKHFEAIIKAAPDTDYAFIAEGWIISSYGNEKLWNEAFARAKKLLSKVQSKQFDPNDLIPYQEKIQQVNQAIAFAYMKKGEFDKALEMFEEIKRKDILKENQINVEWLDKQIEECNKNIKIEK